MKKKTIGLYLAAFFFIIRSYAQINEFNLADYKLPDLKRHSLETYFSLNGYNDYRKYPDGYYYNMEDINDNFYYGDLSIEYNSCLNNAFRQKETDLGLDLWYRFNNLIENRDLVSKDFSIYPSFYCNTIGRMYYKYNFFIETDVNLYYAFEKERSTHQNTGIKYIDDFKTHSITGYLPVKIGFGRIEQVQDARHAIYLFDELAEQKRVTGDKSKDEIIEFAELISQLKNKRFFDSRIRKIYELEAVDSFLMSNDYIIKSDARYFTTLSDFWTYGNRPVRNSGTRFSAAIYPGYHFYDFNLTTANNYIDGGNSSMRTLLLNGGLEFKHEKPVNLYWQNAVDINGFIGIIEGDIRDEINNNDYKLRIPNLQLGFSQKIGFYPNTRTDIEYSYSLQYIQMFDKSVVEEDIFGAGGKGIKVSSELQVNYYLSPKFRLYISCFLHYIWEDSEDMVNINFSNPVGMEYLNYLWYDFTSYNFISYIYYPAYTERDFRNSFRISLIYSIF